MIRRTVLIVDDNHINRKILHRILINDYNIIEASNGKDALDILNKSYESISAILLDIFMPVMNGYEFLCAIHKSDNLSQIPTIVTTENNEGNAEAKALELGANDFVVKPYNPHVIKCRLRNAINLRENASIVNSIRIDALTGLLSRSAFLENAEKMIQEHDCGYYIMSCFDIDNFKVINDQYGSVKGDEILKFIADVLKKGFESEGGICSRITADHFAILYPSVLVNSAHIKDLIKKAADFDSSIQPITFSIGRYKVNDFSLSASAMYDRAVIAKNTVKKSRYGTKIVQYEESMRQEILREQEIINEMYSALKSEQFEIWIQPQYNHSSGSLIGSEALIRWRHPKKGLIQPGSFIPIFEKNGFIYEIDKYVWEKACKLLRKWIDEKISPLPISVNVSRYDIFRKDFYDVITGYIKKYNISVNLLRLEITESAFTTSTEQIISVVEKLTKFGFTVEIDDFGSGYSSLNTLKDVPANVLKLDMRFLEGSHNSGRGGNIVESVIRMARWINMSVIAEGVETKAQADYLSSVGCAYVQGFLYAKPMQICEYEELYKKSGKEQKMIALETVESLDNNTFWNPTSIETLIFNTYVGGAFIFEHYKGKNELLRINTKYAHILGDNMTIEEAMNISLINYMNESDIALLNKKIQTAVITGSDTVCEFCLRHLPGSASNKYLCATIRLIARAGIRMLFYCSVIDMTSEKESEYKIIQSDKQLDFLNKTAHDLVAQSDPDSDIDTILHRILDYFGGNRTYIIELDYKKKISLNTYEVCADGVTSEKSNLQAVPFESCLFWFEAFEHNSYIDIGNVDRLDESRAEEKRILKSQGINSLLAVPMNNNGKLIGFIGVDDPTKNQSHIIHLQAIGDYIAVMLSRRDLNARLDNHIPPENLLPFVFKSMLKSSTDFMFVKDKNLKYICCGKTFANMVGFENESDVIGKTDFDLFDKVLAERYRSDDCSLLKNGKPLIDIEEPIPEKNGTYRYSSTSKYLLYDASGNIVGLYGIGRDITKQKRIEENLIIREQEYNIALSQMGKMIFIYNVASKTLTLPDDYAMKYSTSNTITDIQDTIKRDKKISESSRNVYLEFFKAIHRGEKTGNTEMRIPCENDSFCWKRAEFFTITDSSGNPTEALITIEDTTMKHIEENENEAIRANERILQMVMVHSNRMVYRYDIKSRTASANISIYPDKQIPMTGTNLPESAIRDKLVLPESIEDFRAFFNSIHEGKPDGCIKVHMRTIDGQSIWADMRYSIIKYAGKTPILAALSYEDITADHDREMAFERYSQIMAHDESKDGVAFFDTDLTADIVERLGINIPSIKFLPHGCTHMQAVNYGLDTYIEEDEREPIRNLLSRDYLLKAFSQNKKNISGDLNVTFLDKSHHCFHMNIQMIKDPYSNHIRSYIILRDITEKISAERAVKKQAETDGMTGLLNKVTTEKLINQRIASSNGASYALIVADLDNLKSINDNLGHSKGDNAICYIADTLRAYFSDTNIIGRIGGDEFVVFLNNTDEESLHSLLSSFMKGLTDKNKGQQVTASVGAAISNYDTYNELFNKADSALYHVKRSGKKNYAVYHIRQTLD